MYTARPSWTISKRIARTRGPSLSLSLSLAARFRSGPVDSLHLDRALHLDTPQLALVGATLSNTRYIFSRSLSTRLLRLDKKHCAPLYELSWGLLVCLSFFFFFFFPFLSERGSRITTREMHGMQKERAGGEGRGWGWGWGWGELINLGGKIKERRASVCVHTHTHTHTHMYVCMYVCMYVYIFFFLFLKIGGSGSFLFFSPHRAALR